jgi:BetI-type transcriptional repressor, C-terminal
LPRRATALTLLADAGLTPADLDIPLEATRLHALLDGLAVHAVMRPESVTPERIKAVIARHLDTLQAGPSSG